MANKKKTGKPKMRPKKRKLSPNAKPRKPNKKGQKYKSSSLRKLLTALGITGAAITAGIFGHNLKSSNSNTYTVAKVQDLEGDEFDNSVPLYQNDELIAVIPDQDAVIIETDPSLDEGQIIVYALDSNGNLITGVTNDSYIDQDSSIKLKEDDERLKYGYIVTGTDYVNVRNATTLSDESRIGLVKERRLRVWWR